MPFPYPAEQTLTVTKKNWSMTYLRDGNIITKSAGRDLALMKTDWRGDAYDKGDHADTYMRQMLSLSVGELVYGMGERFTPFIKNGQSVDIWNADGGTSTEQSYKNIPFYLTNKGYGVLVNHPEMVSFEVGTEMVTRTEFSVEGGYLDYFLINGPSMKEVLTRYTDLTGKPSLPAPWTFGLWLSTSFTTNYDEETVMSFVDGMINRGILAVCHHADKDIHRYGLSGIRINQFGGIASPVNLHLLRRFAVDMHGGTAFVFVLLDVIAELRIHERFVTGLAAVLHVFRPQELLGNAVL